MGMLFIIPFEDANYSVIRSSRVKIRNSSKSKYHD
jgi:hypothetical protein